MNEQTTKLIEQLAAKLGTTAEHLWGVLVRQAPISSTSDLLTLLGCVLGIYLGTRLIRSALKWKDDDAGLAAMIGTVICMIVLGIILIVGLCSIGTIASGFFNPEYWAFRQIVK